MLQYNILKFSNNLDLMRLTSKNEEIIIFSFWLNLSKKLNRSYRLIADSDNFAVMVKVKKFNELNQEYLKEVVSCNV